MANFDMTLTLTPSDSLENRRLIGIGPYSLEPGGRNYKGFYNVFVTKIHLNGSLELLTPLEREIDFCHQMVKDMYPIIARISRVGVRTEELRQKMTHMLHNTSWCHLHLLLLTKLFQFLTPPKSCTLNALCGLRFRPFLKSYLVELTFC